MRILQAVALSALLTGTALAQEKILLPVILETPLPGAHGSSWTTTLSVVNSSSEITRLDGVATSCIIPPCLAAELRPGATLFPIVLAAPAGRFLVADAPERLAINLRVQDISRAAMTWGTQLPTVRESEALRGATSLIDIPGTERFRSLLRVYDFDPAPDRQVLLRVFRLDPSRRLPEQQITDLVLHEEVLQFAVPGNPIDHPGYATFALASVPGIEAEDRVRIELVPLTQGLRYWAFVSVTNDETQHVTVVAPSR